MVIPLNQCFQLHTINNMNVYVVDDHHKALAAWAIIRRSMTKAPNLITIDHHTDTHEAFLGYSHWEAYEGRVQDQELFRLNLIAQLNWQNDESIADAIAKLRHDEHIDAATCSKTLDNAFCIQLSDSGVTQSNEEIAFTQNRQENWPNPPTVPTPQRPMTYTPTPNRIYAIPFDCFIGCNAMPHDDDCLVQQANEVIESRYLDDQLERGAEISRCIGLAHLESEPYVLDIDLDVFHTRKAISPQDPSTFYRLIRNAVGITIATEADCVEEEWLDNEYKMSSDELLQEMLAHIEKAL